MKRRLFNLLAIGSAILFVAVCVFWLRSRTRWDEVTWMYCRYLPDKSITSDEAHFISESDGLELMLMHGHVPPRPVDLVRGYDVNADETHGRPRVWFSSEAYDGLVTYVYSNAPSPIFRSPINFSTLRRQQPKDIDDGRTVALVMSHWLLTMLLLVMPVWWLKRARDTRRAGRLGLCSKCGYDLRATPERCPECGTPARGCA
jgi:hypothetical protein